MTDGEIEFFCNDDGKFWVPTDAAEQDEAGLPAADRWLDIPDNYSSSGQARNTHHD